MIRKAIFWLFFVRCLTGIAAGGEITGRLPLTANGHSYEKRFVLRFPDAPGVWNGKLVVGAHGGTGGERFDLEGQVLGTDETALDDVIGDFALAHGFAYASLDREGIGGTREGLRLTKAFTHRIKEDLERVFDRPVARVYLFGLSMGGAVGRYAAEEDPPAVDGVVLIAGAGGDLPTRLHRQAALAVLWREIDPSLHPGIPDHDARVQRFAEAAGTPVAARVFWPFIASQLSLDGLEQTLSSLGLTGLSPAELARFQVDGYTDRAPFAKRLRQQNATGRLTVPTIEVVGTYDDVVLSEIRAYEKKVNALAAGASGVRPADRYRLYQIEGAWHISGDDDAMASFRYLARRRHLEADLDRALREAPSYLPVVRQSLLLLDRWVAHHEPPPPDQTVAAGGGLVPSQGLGDDR